MNKEQISNALIFIIILYAVIFLFYLSGQITNNAFFLLISIISTISLLIALFIIIRNNKYLQRIENDLEGLLENRSLNKSRYTSNNFLSTYRKLYEIEEKLQKFNAKVSKQKEGFHTIIETIKEAIWIQDEKGIIKTCNSSFNKLVNNPNVKDQYFWNVIREKEVYEFADRIYDQPQDLTEEISLEDKHYLGSSSYSKLNEETVFILYDITEFRQLETMKKDFILNVSHELRTPLTSIKGYVETMVEDAADDETAVYLDVLQRNTNRLIHIVNDLLSLSKLESLQTLELEKVEINEFLENIIKIFSQRIDKTYLKLIKKINTTSKYLIADRYMLEQVFINLIDNALKYTEKGEISILVSEDDRSLVFSVKDTGCGIETQHLNRLFERFFVVDKSRSRSLGGTGLGLSIVKHIINLHNGIIEVESEVDVGTEFKIIMPKEQNEQR